MSSLNLPIVSTHWFNSCSQKPQRGSFPSGIYFLVSHCCHLGHRSSAFGTWPGSVGKYFYMDRQELLMPRSLLLGATRSSAAWTSRLCLSSLQAEVNRGCSDHSCLARSEHAQPGHGLCMPRLLLLGATWVCAAWVWAAHTKFTPGQE